VLFSVDLWHTEERRVGTRLHGRGRQSSDTGSPSTYKFCSRTYGIRRIYPIVSPYLTFAAFGQIRSEFKISPEICSQVEISNSARTIPAIYTGFAEKHTVEPNILTAESEEANAMDADNDDESDDAWEDGEGGGMGEVEKVEVEEEEDVGMLAGGSGGC
jgi:hypothetical protein